jgi:hypothetical protein
MIRTRKEDYKGPLGDRGVLSEVILVTSLINESKTQRTSQLVKSYATLTRILPFYHPKLSS